MSGRAEGVYVSTYSRAVECFGEGRLPGEERFWRTRVGGYIVRLSGWGGEPRPWQRMDFAFLGTIEMGGFPLAWAWHLDGRSIDRGDNGFDLVDFPQELAFLETVAADG